MYILPEDNNVEVGILEKLLDLDKLTMSYKLFWFAGILEEIKNSNQDISFRRIVCRMLAASWYPLLQYRLNLGVGDQLNNIVTLLHTRHNLPVDIREKDLLEFLEKMQDTEIEKAISSLYNFVPYRLIAPFFSRDLAGIKNNNSRNIMIADLSQKTTRALYKINRSDKRIYINNAWFDYIYRNQGIVAGWHKFKTINYLQKKNPNTPAIPFKLSIQSKRNLSSATKFWNSIKERQILYDIYSGQVMTRDNFEKYGEMSIDHFIPWSFVLHDELWNLAPTFKNVNSSKSNKLPKMDLYLDKFCDLQYAAFNMIRQDRKDRESKKILEDHLTINKKLDLNYLLNKDKEITKAEFADSLKATISPLHQIAYNQGYEVWHNDTYLGKN